MEILDIIQKRKTATSFSGKPIDREVILRILEAGRLAPSSKNRQPWRFIVLEGDDKKQKLSEACYGDSRINQSGACIAVCSTNIDYKMPNGQLSYPVDLSFASAFMVLQAENEGLNSAVLTTFSEPDVCTLVTAPYGMKVVMLLLMGEGIDFKRRERHTLERVSSFEHW